MPLLNSLDIIFLDSYADDPRIRCTDIREAIDVLPPQTPFLRITVRGSLPSHGFLY
jgi:hypothetical protein